MSLCLQLSTMNWICYPGGLCWRNRQMMSKVAVFCHHARPRRGQEVCGMNHAPARGAHSSWTPRCTTLHPCSPGTNDIAGAGGLGPRKKGKSRSSMVNKVHSHGRIVCPEENSLAVDAKHVCTRMVFRNSNRTLSVFKDSCERSQAQIQESVGRKYSQVVPVRLNIISKR